MFREPPLSLLRWLYCAPVADRQEVLAKLAVDDDQNFDDEPPSLLRSELNLLDADDLPVGLRIEVLDRVDSKGVRYVALDGVLVRDSERSLVAVIEEQKWRKFWPGSLGVEEYVGLVRTAIEVRERSRGDVRWSGQVDDGVVYGVTYEIPLPWGNIRKAFDYARTIHAEILEVAEAVRAGVDDLVATAFKRLDGWGQDPLDELVDRMRDGAANQKGKTLEELSSRLFNTVPGFSSTGHVVTATEEVDIRIQNTSDDPYWRQERYLLLAECKNWSTSCGKDEFVIFKNKLRNRVGRATCGFLISWNGFADTVTKEMLRGSEGDLLVVPITGQDLRGAVRDGDFEARLRALHSDAVFL